MKLNGKLRCDVEVDDKDVLQGVINMLYRELGASNFYECPLKIDKHRRIIATTEVSAGCHSYDVDNVLHYHPTENHMKIYNAIKELEKLKNRK